METTKIPHLRMYATNWCGDWRRARQFLHERRIPFEEIDIDRTREPADFMTRANQGKRKVPTVDVGGRVFHGSPFDPAKLTRELDL